VSGDSERSPCIKGRSSSVRSVVVLSLHQNGLSIGPSVVFGTYGPARRAGTGLNIQSISPQRKYSPFWELKKTNWLPKHTARRRSASDHCSPRNSSDSLAMFAAIRRALSFTSYQTNVKAKVPATVSAK
jgi:hypothetical protein